MFVMKSESNSEADHEDKYLTRLSYYNVTTRLVDLVGLCWLKKNVVEQIC